MDVECPVCGLKLSPTNINSHVNMCLDQTKGETKTARADSLKCSVGEPCAKRVKVDGEITKSCPAKKADWGFMVKKSDSKTPVKGTLGAKSNEIHLQQNSAEVSKKEVDVKSTQNRPSTASFDLHSSNVPLAERVRPTSLKDFVGQEQTIGRKKLLRSLFEANKIPSMIFWGPPGCGKTTLAKIIAHQCKESHNTRFVKLSATTSGIADVKEVVKVAKNQLSLTKRGTILFVDEIHRFNKLQQDSFLPHVEDGTIVLIGATTENPSFQVNNALLSRCQVITLEKLNVEEIQTILRRALREIGATMTTDPQHSGADSESDGHVVQIEPDAIATLANFSDGDARAALNALENVVKSKTRNSSISGFEDEDVSVITVADVKDAMLKSHLQYDRNGEEHYNCASALQKSIRGSDENAAVYWMMRMFEGGEDPLFIARRLVVTASEDIGLADPQAMPLAVSTFQACHFLGRPECSINLAHCVTYLARAPKSCESTKAMLLAKNCISQWEGPQPSVPLHLRNAPTQLMKNLGCGKGYRHTVKPGDTQQFMPEELKDVNFFTEEGVSKFVHKD